MADQSPHINDLLQTYREGGEFPSYDQLAAIAGQDQGGAADRGEAVALTEAEIMEALTEVQYPAPVRLPIGWVYFARAIEKKIASKVSARAADAPSEPSEPPRLDTEESREYLVKFMEQHFTDTTFHSYIRGQIGGSGPLAGDFAWQMARALRRIEAGVVKSRAADALDSQPTVLAYVATDLDGHADVGMTREKAMERAGHGCDTIIPVYDLGNSQPTEPYPLLRAAFTTAESGADGYFVKFKFPTMAAMQAAHQQWHTAAIQPTVAAQQGSIADDALFQALLDNVAQNYDAFLQNTNVHGFMSAIAGLHAYVDHLLDSRASSAPVAPIAPYAYEETNGDSSSLVYAAWFTSGRGKMDEEKTYEPLYRLPQQEGSEAGNG